MDLSATKNLHETHVPWFHTYDTSKINYSYLGCTDMKVSKLGLGCGPLGASYGTVKENEAVQTVVEAIKNGINYIDTAPWYGFGKSEVLLGRALKQIPRESYYIATKVGRYSPQWSEMFDFSARKTLSSFNESLSKLGLDYVDVIQVHDVEFASSQDIIINETLPALASIVEQGKARYIGITGYPLEMLKEIVERSTVKIDLILSYSRYTLFDQSLENYLTFFKENNVAVINAAFLGMGLLSTGKLPDWHLAQEEIRIACRKSKEYCQLKGVSITYLATCFSLRKEGFATNLAGMDCLNYLEESLKALQDGLSNVEEETLTYILENYFDPLKTRNWEGIEISKYRRKVEVKPQD